MTDQYEKIVSSLDAPTLVLAGPGAGKTYLLADRLKRLLQRQDTDKSQLTMVAFSKDAAEHIRRELVKHEGHFRLDPAELPPIRTLHSLGFEILCEKPRLLGLRKTGLAVQDDEGVKQLLFRDAALLAGCTEDEAAEARRCKERGNCTEEMGAACRVCSEYWQIMRACNRIDFDDQILFACRVLESDSVILAKHQAGCRHLLVDEYQDINAAQFRLIQLLSRDHVNGLFVVGDDAQSIYGFRGADPRLILRFASDFAGATTPPLSHSRRCPEGIMAQATKVLSAFYPNWTGPQELTYHRPPGEPPAVWCLPSEKAEARMVAHLARRFVADRKSVLVLAPKKDFFRLVSAELRKRGVAHECPASLLPRQTELRLRSARTFLEWVSGPSDSFLTRLVIEELMDRGAARVPGVSKGRRCSPETIRRRVQEETRIATLWRAVDSGTSLYDVVRGSDEGGTIRIIRELLAELVDTYADWKGDRRGDFAKILAMAMGGWEDPSNLANDICAALSQLDPIAPSGEGYAQLLTMRRAKGLEADIVIILGLEDDIMPSPGADLAEEARLFYVSMTRAKEKLFLLHAMRRPRDISFGEELLGKARSRFLDALGFASEYKTPS